MSEKSNQDQAHEGILLTLRNFTKGYLSFEPTPIVQSLDPDSDGLTYQPEERPDALTSRDEVQRYIEKLDQVIGGFADTRVIETKIDVIGEIAHVFVRFWCRIHRVDGDFVDGQVRQTFVLRSRGNTWFIRHYHESRQIPGFPVFEVKE